MAQSKKTPLKKRAQSNAKVNQNDSDDFSLKPTESQSDQEATETTEEEMTPVDETNGDVSTEEDGAEDATEEEVDEVVTTSKNNEKLLKAYDHPRVARPKGRIFTPEEEITYNGEIVGNQLVLKEDHYRVFIPARSLRPVYTLIHLAGATIPLTSLQAK